MATSNTALKVAELDFFKIKDNLKNFLRSQSAFTDYDFEGSSMSVLLDILAYNTYYNAFYLNMVANESFLDTAQIRQNILSHAKLINYVPSSAQGSTTKVNIKVTPSFAEDQSTNYAVLDKYTRFLGQDVNGENFTFVTVNSNTALKVNGSFTFSNVIIKQGEVITHQYEVSANNKSRRFQLPSSNVDTSTLVVTVQESFANTYTSEYMLAKDLTTVTANSKVYWIEEDENLYHTIYFGDDILGKKPKNGNIVIATYLDTLGSMTNNVSQFIAVEAIADKFRDNVRISTVQTSYGGVDKEDIESIRFRAPHYYTAQNRAVTINDYESLLVKDYNNIDSVSIWGGEDNDPVVYGKVYISIKTKGFYELTEIEKEKIKNEIIGSRSVLTVTPEIVDPDYTFLMIKGTITYNPNLTTKSAEELKNLVKASINSYNINELNNFRSIFKKAKLQAYIADAEPSVTGSDIKIYMQKRSLLEINKSKKYIFSYNCPLNKGSLKQKLYTYPSVTLLDQTNVARDIFLEEAPDSDTSIKSIIITNPGYNYEATPTITIIGDGSGAVAKADIVGGRLNSITLTNAGKNYTRASVVITGDGKEATATAVLASQNGTLRSFYFKSNGEKFYVNENIGSIDYQAGKITVNPIFPKQVETNPYYDDNIFTMNAIADSDIISPVRNSILAIDSNDGLAIQIEMVPEV